MRTADGPFPMETTYTWEPLDAGATRMTLRNRGRPAGFSARRRRRSWPAAMRRANRKDLAALRPGSRHAPVRVPPDRATRPASGAPPSAIMMR